nr:MAG TPA: hypothetical protein [Caudoviricetes sp.]
MFIYSFLNLYSLHPYILVCIARTLTTAALYANSLGPYSGLSWPAPYGCRYINYTYSLISVLGAIDTLNLAC